MRHPQGEPESGMALIAVMWINLALSLAIGVMLLLSHQMARDTILNVNHSQNQIAVDGALRQTIVHLLDRDDGWLANGQHHQIEWGGQTVEVSIKSEHSRADINTASIEQLKAALLMADLGEVEASMLADRIADWRDEDLDPRDLGREHYPDLAYEPRNGPYEHLSELTLLPDIDKGLYGCLEASLTVHSGLRHIVTNDDRIDDGNVYRLIAKSAQADRLAIVRLTGDIHDPYWILEWDHLWQSPCIKKAAL